MKVSGVSGNCPEKKRIYLSILLKNIIERTKIVSVVDKMGIVRQSSNLTRFRCNQVR